MRRTRLPAALALLCSAAAQASFDPLQLSVPFVPNHGQLHEAVAFRADTRFGALYVTRRGELVYALKGADAPPGLTERLLGAEPEQPRGVYQASTRVTSLLGNDPRAWRRNLPTYRRVTLGEVWPGVTFDVAAHHDNAEKLFEVQPHADPAVIQVAVDGARALHVDEDGSLVVETAGRALRFSSPVAFQTVGGERQHVEVAYALGEATTYGFVLGDYDRRLPVVIDPILQSTFLGGAGGADDLSGIVVDPATGDLLAFGTSDAADFPATAGGQQTAPPAGNPAGFVARIAADLTATSGGVLQATYLGSTGAGTILGTSIFALAIDQNGEVIVAGTTSDTDLPLTGGAGAQNTHAGGIQDGFIARLGNDLSSIIAMSYYGNNASQIVDEVVFSNDFARIYVGGDTGVVGALPGVAGGAQATPGGGLGDAFVAVLSADLQTIERASYHGGSNGNERVEDLLVDPVNGDLIVTASTSSADFPDTASGAIPDKPNTGPSMQATVARFSADLTSRIRATYFGGSDFTDGPTALAIHPQNGDIYLTGNSESTDIPGTTGALQPNLAGSADAYVARFSADLTQLVGATYFGGSATESLHRDIPRDILIHPVSGEIYLGGTTVSVDIPGTAGGAQESLTGGAAGAGDVYLVRMSADLSTLIQATYFGGTGGVTRPAAMAFTLDGNQLYVAGGTAASSLAALANGAQSSQPGNGDAYITRLDFTLTAQGPQGAGTNADTVLEAIAKGGTGPWLLLVLRWRS